MREVGWMAKVACSVVCGIDAKGVFLLQLCVSGLMRGRSAELDMDIG